MPVGSPDPPDEHRLRVLTFNTLAETLNDMFSYQFVVLQEDGGDFLQYLGSASTLVNTSENCKGE